ncbi:MAG: hypothetical protein GY865_03865 [candidate division Zixibacteria bacterium]|nr:hypothetical protein [candidate division Zixibacteria bacterium]
MNLNLEKNQTTIFAAIPIIIIFILIAYGVISNVVALGNEPPQVILERPDAKYDNCVENTEYMRYHHWELLRGIRENIVRYGIRGDVNLNKCKECHTSRVNFCDQCHNAVSMAPDCFGCHNYP